MALYCDCCEAETDALNYVKVKRYKNASKEHRVPMREVTETIKMCDFCYKTQTSEWFEHDGENSVRLDIAKLVSAQMNVLFDKLRPTSRS